MYHLKTLRQSCWIVEWDGGDLTLAGRTDRAADHALRNKEHPAHVEHLEKRRRRALWGGVPTLGAKEGVALVS